MTTSGTSTPGALILALETATPVCGVALMHEGRAIAVSCLDVGLRHSQLLFSEIQRLLEVARATLEDVSHVAVSIGPGSFTGLRIGLSAAKGLCLPTDTPLVAVRTLQALAARVPHARSPVCALLDARRGQVYAGLYDTTTGWPEQLEEERALCPEDLMTSRAGQATIFTGPGVNTCLDLMERAGGSGSNAAFADCWRPDAAAVGQLAATGLATGRLHSLDGRAMEALEPAYLRAPDVRPPVKRPLQY